MTKVAASRQRVIGRGNNLHHKSIVLPRATRPTVEAPDRESLGLGKACFLWVFSLLLLYIYINNNEKTTKNRLFIYIYISIKPYYRWFKDA